MALNPRERLWRTKVKLGKTPGSQQSARGGYLFSHKALGKVLAATVRAALMYRRIISERDILRCKDGMVTFRYRDAQTGKSATRTLSGADFVWLLLQNILPKGFVRARNFGFLHHNSRRSLRRGDGDCAPAPTS